MNFFPWREAIVGAACNGITPQDLYEMSLCEYNYFIEGKERARRYKSAECILTGFYAAYYVNGGNKARKPRELIDSLCGEKKTYADNAAMIDKTKSLYGDD